MTKLTLKRGRWQTALKDVTCDAVITDPPYSARTHQGHNEGARTRSKTKRSTLNYDAWELRDVLEFVGTWAPRCRGWFVAMTDHALAGAWLYAYEQAGLYAFAPLQYMQTGSRVRLQGDGPSLWSVTICVARPRRAPYSKWGALPGGYVLPQGESRESFVTGGKPLWIMQQLVRHYSQPGDTICDPYAGGATTLMAAGMLGRNAIGAEADNATYARAAARLEQAWLTKDQDIQ